MKTTNFDAVLACSPLNATAGAVTSRGAEWAPELKMHEGRVHSKDPLPTMPFSAKKICPQDDLTGRKFGRFTVIGFSAVQNPKKNGTWVVRCACGSYEIRRGKGIKAANDPDDCCVECMHLKIVKRRYERDGAASLETFIKKGAQ